MSLPPLIQGLLDPAAYPHPAGKIRLIETHISWVLIAGDYAYKIKKPIDLGFLDFSTLEKRRFCCEEEIRLNGRLAPETYLEAVPVSGRLESPRIDGAGMPLEWAVKMRAFPADATLDRETSVTPKQIDAIADQIARFHVDSEAAAPESAFGTPETVIYPVRENFRQIRALPPQLRTAKPVGPQLERLEAWSETQFALLHDHFLQRKAAGQIRDCHGDLHLGNIAWVDERPLVFDCIEFNPALRCIDPISEIAFLAMDLLHRGLDPLAWRFLNRWLEHTGDYAGMRAFRFYLVYRAMVRAKVAGIRASQGATDAAGEAAGYLDLAERLGQARQPYLLLMHGFSGCGKTWLAQRLLETLGCLRLRSDVERKRLAGLGATDRSGSGLAGGLYGAEATRHTFEHLRATTATLLEAGFPVIVDATFLKRDARRPFLGLALAMGLAARILSLQAEPNVLRARIRQRQAEGQDASEADLRVLEHQLHNHDPLAADESDSAVFLASDVESHWPASVHDWYRTLRMNPGPQK
jgi:hypothetical protein